MREVVLDTETTGFAADAGDRIVEIGCIELINHVPTDNHYQCYLNPERDMPSGAFAVHGLSAEFLADKPLFADVVEDFLSFIGSDPLIIHNAVFDLGFIDAELARLKRPALDRSHVIDTVSLARRKFPGAPANLDALCRRFTIDLSTRGLHGALLDAGLLAEVYLALIGGRQPGLGLASDSGAKATARPIAEGAAPREPRHFEPSAAESKAHDAFINDLKDPIWRR